MELRDVFKNKEKTATKRFVGKELKGQIINKIRCRGNSANIIYDFYNIDGEVFHSDMGFRNICKQFNL